MNEVQIAVNAGTPDPRLLERQYAGASKTKRTGTGKPTLSWTLIVRNASKTLETCLRSLRAMTPEAEIVIVDTMSNDCPTTMDQVGMKSEPETVRIAKKYADVFVEYAGPNGTWTREMYAFDDAAAARNHALSFATGDWVGWIDADDELLGPAETQKLLALNGMLPTRGVSELKGLETKAETDEGKKPLPTRQVAGLEDVLRALPQAMPDATGFWCPYLYKFAWGEEGKVGKAAEWQKRERIVRRDPETGKLGWRWHRKAHEFLAPDGRHLYGGMKQMPTLLFVHRKEWTAEDALYSIKRHYEIVKKEYDAGVREFRDIYYLCIYAPTMCPELKGHYMDELLKYAVMKADRSQAHAMRGSWFAEKGFVAEATESYAAGITADESFPDNYFGMAQVYEDGDRWGKATEWYMKAVKVPPTHLNSLMSPRDALVANRVRGAMCALFASRAEPGNAETYLKAAVELAEDAIAEPGATLADEGELSAYLGLFKNELRSIQVLKQLHTIHKVLIENDETLKAAKVLDVVPHNVTDHPLAREMEVHAAKLQMHATDPVAYAKFYESEVVTGAFMDEGQLAHLAKMPRVLFAIEQLTKLRAELDRPLRVLEVGPWDGVTLLPVMEALKDSQFVAIEVQQKAIEQLLKNAEKRGLTDRLRTVHGIFGETTLAQARNFIVPVGHLGFDAIVFYEVIEHLPDTKPSLSLLRDGLMPEGRLFVSTPWGAYDRGHPRNMDERDVRGHVTAMMPRDVVAAMNEAGLRVLELGGAHEPGNYSDTMHLMAAPANEVQKVAVNQVDHGTNTVNSIRSGSPQFAVAHSLWPWNATEVIKHGIGASEETIVYLARELGRRGGSPEVYGPMPRAESLDESEVRDGVAYWPNTQMRKIDSHRPLVVSRAPGLAKQVREAFVQLGKPMPRTFLWLQDCFYPDLNAKTAADYEKIVVLSHKHREQIARTGVPLEKMKIIPNFLLKEHFPDVPSKCGVVREPHRFIYASSPDRGLIPLLKMWPMIRKHWPDATLGVFYGWQGARKLGGGGSPEWFSMYRVIREQWEELRRLPGVEDHGRVNHAVIANEMRRASVWGYPLFNDEVETFCSNAIKARAAGCVPVVTAGMIPDEALGSIGPSQSLVEEVPDDSKGKVLLEPSSDYAWDFLKACQRAVARTEVERDAMAAEAIEQFELGVIVKKWEELLR